LRERLSIGGRKEERLSIGGRKEERDWFFVEGQ
jgi:hypothetical protein